MPYLHRASTVYLTNRQGSTQAGVNVQGAGMTVEASVEQQGLI